MKGKITKMVPYLNFEGNCEEAIHFYKEVFDGTISMVKRYADSPMNVPENFKDKIIHARLNFGDVEIFASDVTSGKSATKGSGDVALSLDTTDPHTGAEIFNRLSVGGKVGVPFQKQFWGAWHGNLVDKFGIRWMINLEESQQP